MPNRLPTSILLTALLTLATLPAGGCTPADNGTPATPASEAEPSPADIPGISLCTDPRPEICTQQYAPVCGVHDDGSRRTYSNGCTACGNAEVIGSLPGACPEDNEGD
jgi:hypothetical protein